MMQILRSLILIIIWTVIGSLLGAVVAFVMPKQYISTVELAIDTEALSSSGLARFDRLSIADGVEVETLVQLLKSSRVSHAVADKLKLSSYRMIQDYLKVLNEQGSAVVKAKVTADKPAHAQERARELGDHALTIDGERRRQRTADAIAAVDTQLKEVEKQLAALNQQIQKLNADRGITLSNQSERQQRAGTELAQLEQRLAALNVEGASLEDRAKRLDELITALPAGRALPAGFAIQEADKSPALTEGRQRLLEQESTLASLRSRYGPEHAKVKSAEAEIAASRQSLRGLLLTQREILQAQVADNVGARKIIGQKIAETEAEAQRSDLSLDPAHANLLAQRDALVTTYNALTTRSSELRVYAGAHPASFYVFSDATLPYSASLLRPAAILALGCACGALLGFAHCLRRWSHAAPSASAHAAS